VNILDKCLNVAIYTIFGVNSNNVWDVRRYLDLPLLQDTIEIRRVKFMDKVHLLPDFEPVLQVLTLDWV
jgi:hypothetical protein